MIVDTDFCELAAVLLPLRLRFLITSVTLWSFCRGERKEKDEVQHLSPSLPTCRRTPTKNKPHALHSGWPCGPRLQRQWHSCSSCTGSVLLQQWGTSHQWRRCLVYWKQQRRLSPLQKRRLRATAPLVLLRLWGRLCPTPVRTGALPIECGAEPSPPRVCMDCRRARVLRCPRTSISGLAAPPEPFLLPTEPVCGICLGRAVAPLLSRAANSPMWVYIAQTSVPASTASAVNAGAVVAESNPPC